MPSVATAAYRASVLGALLASSPVLTGQEKDTTAIYESFPADRFPIGSSPDGVGESGSGFSSPWTFTADGEGAFVEIIAGLEMPGLRTEGAAVLITAEEAGGPTRARLERRISGETPPNGSLWGSFVVQQMSEKYLTGGDGRFTVTGVRFGEKDREFFVTPKNGSAWKQAFSAEAGLFKEPTVSEEFDLPPGTPHLVVVAFENINFGSYTSNEAQVTLWILSPEDVAALGGQVTVAALDQHHRLRVQKAVTSKWGVGGLEPNMPFRLIVEQGTAAFDEIRWGSSLKDVLVLAPAAP
ncbi:MAG: hypothetical protein SFU53_05830 [Terrimicrobiaceae bacterium]|nr:hypothetical protein [Terrimicrobiaceae bacterium]